MTANGSHSLVLLLTGVPSPDRAPLVDASVLAVELGVSRDWVYEHADALGVLRLGNGPKARLRFDPVAARAALSRFASERSRGPDLALDGGSAGVEHRQARRVGGSSATGRPQPTPILPVRPRRKAGAHADQ